MFFKIVLIISPQKKVIYYVLILKIIIYLFFASPFHIAFFFLNFAIYKKKCKLHFATPQKMQLPNLEKNRTPNKDPTISSNIPCIGCLFGMNHFFYRKNLNRYFSRATIFEKFRESRFYLASNETFEP